uniref:Calponin-homology (CH) domain-containing protein n=1 Tax=Heterorhabditis bacteriophora TaxID=37862 RepID=A0A1I7XV78_HETBA
MNVQMALDALREDRVKTVNIGSHDIVEGNTKLILGLIWCLVQRYQIASRTKIPPKKLVMAWMQSVLPDLKLTNFRTNWNDGQALCALLDYCQPGLCPEWKQMDLSQTLENCKRGLALAEQYLGIPQIISPEHLSSPHLDELSCLTYLSYFITKGAPGYRATLQRVQLVPELDDHMHFNTLNDYVFNISIALEAAAEIGVGSLVGAEDIADPQGEHLGTMALAAALCSVGPQPTIPITQCFLNQQVNLDLAFADGGEVRVDELDVNVFGSSGRALSHSLIRLRKSRTAKGAVISMIPFESGYHKVSIFCQKTELPSSPIFLHVLSSEDSRAVSRTLTSPVNSKFDKQLGQSSSSPIHLRQIERSDSGSEVDISHKSFEQRRLHIIKQLEAQTAAINKESNLTSPPPSQTREWLNRTEKQGSPQQAVILEASAHREMLLSRHADVGLVSFSGLTEPCSVGSIVEVVINAHGECSIGSVHVDAVSPSGRTQKCPVSKRANCYMATFTPQEVGRWKIGILYEGEHIKGSPFSCQVFDASLVNVYGLDVGLVGQELKFTVNASQAGQGDLKMAYLNVTVLRHGREIKTVVDEQGNSQVYRVNFVPDGAGQYKIHVLFNRMEVKGSPFILDIADASTVSVYGENLRMGSVGKLATFMIHAVGAESKDIIVSVTAPSGRVKTAQVLTIDDASFKAEWTPQEAGEHSIDVRLYNQSVYESPFACNVGVPELVSVRSMPRKIYAKSLYKDHSFEIDASAAGSGNLEIMINGGRVPCRVRELGSRQYMAIFTPTQVLTVENIPFGSSPRVPESILLNTELNRCSRLYGLLTICYNYFSTHYYCFCVGEHLLTVLIAGRKVDGSPLSVSGYSAERVRLEPLGGGAIGQPVQFVALILMSGPGGQAPMGHSATDGEYNVTEEKRVKKLSYYSQLYVIPAVDAVDAGKGQLEISVNQGRVPNNVQMQGAGRCLVTFIPQHPGTYVIDVTFNGEQVHGCPIKVEILPKQVGQAVQANLTPTAVSTAISAGAELLFS